MRRILLIPRIFSALFALGSVVPDAGAYVINVVADSPLTISYTDKSAEKTQTLQEKVGYYWYPFQNTVLATAPKRPGYAFDGWKTLADNHTSGTIDLVESCTRLVDANETLSANHATSEFRTSIYMSSADKYVVSPTYTLMPLNVNYKENGGSGTMDPQGPFDINSSFSLTPNAFSKTGYAFAGWTNAVGAVFSDGALVSGSNFWNESTWSFDEQLMAKWVLKTNTIVVATQGTGTGVVTGGGNYAYGTVVTLTATAADGSTFTGWTDGNKSSPRQVTMGETDAIYTAVFDRIPTYMVEFRYRDSIGNTVCDVREDVRQGETLTPPSNSVVNCWAHHKFVGWDSLKYINVLENAIIRAEYEAIKYSVGFDANGGAGLQMDPLVFESYETSQALTANTYTRTGYRFLGWSADKNAKTPTYSDGQTVSKLNNGVSFTLYAIWDPIAYSIEFSGGTGTIGSMATTNVLYDQVVVLPKNAFVKPGCTFQMWKCADKSFADGATVSNLTTTADETVTLVATWDAPFWVDYKANGGKGLMSPQRFEKGIQQPLTSNRFTRVGYHFDGWSTNISETALFTDGQVVSDADFPGTSDGTTNVLFAVWQPLTLSEAMMAVTNLEWTLAKTTSAQPWEVAGDQQDNTWAQQTAGESFGNQQFLVARIPERGRLTFRWRTSDTSESSLGLRFQITDQPNVQGYNACYLSGGAIGEWQTFSTNVFGIADTNSYFQLANYSVQGVRIDISQMTWIPAVPVPGVAAAVTAAGIDDGVFKMCVAGKDEQAEYGVWTNADLTVDSWGLMEKQEMKDPMWFKFSIIPECPQLFFKAYKVDWRCE